MSGIKNQISDQTIQAVALLGGATAQSYSAVSLNVSPVAPDLQHADASLPTPDPTDKSAGSDTESTLQSLEKLFIDTFSPVVTSRPVSSNTPEELIELPNGFVQPDIQNPELMSRFEGSSLEDEGTFGIQQTGFSGTTLITDELPEALGTVGTGFSLLDFIEQAIAQAEASQQEFGETFDGGRQGEFRELLVDTGMAVGSGIREFLQENVAGVGRELVSSSIDAMGVEFLDSTADPLLNVDYYAKSAEVLNGLLDYAAQPIGSIALPQVGPLLADPREELSAYLG